MKTDIKRIENTVLLRVHKAGGQAQRRDIWRSLVRYKKKDKETAFSNLISEDLIELGEVVRLGPGPYRKIVAITDKGKARLQEMIDQGLVQE